MRGLVRPTHVQLYRGCPPNPHANPGSYRKQARAFQLHQTFPSLLLIQHLSATHAVHWHREMQPRDYFIHRVIAQRLKVLACAKQEEK